MKHGKIIYLMRYMDAPNSTIEYSMGVGVMRTTLFGKKKIDYIKISGFVNEELEVGDEVYYCFDKDYPSKCCVIKKEERK